MKKKIKSYSYISFLFNAVVVNLAYVCLCVVWRGPSPVNPKLNNAKHITFNERSMSECEFKCVCERVNAIRVYNQQVELRQ